MTGRGSDVSPEGRQGLPAPDLELDCRDLRCPMPVIELGRHIDDVEAGQVVGVVARDVAARVDVPACAGCAGTSTSARTPPRTGARYLVRRLSQL